MNPELQTFVRDALARGVPRERIREALKQARWPEDEIGAALEAWEDAGLGVPVPRRRAQISARETFLHLLLFATLYIVAYQTGAILFAGIERALPDPAAADAVWHRWRETVRFGVASLFVAFPVFLWTARVAGRAVAADPEKRGSGARRWLTWLTLFVAACVLIGNFIVVVMGLLAGEITVRFVLKAAVVAAIAGALFAYYLGGLRRDEGEAGARVRRRAWFPRAAGIAVLATLGVGLVLAGSPARVRKEQLDRRRLRDLQQISQSLERWYARHRSLPARLAELRAGGPDITLASVRDPVTGAPYAYRPLSPTRYELCATFSAADSLGPWGEPNPFWRHGPGRSCFTFQVAP